MKLKFRLLPTAVMLLTTWPAAAEVIYSNALNTSIPLDFNGVTINVGTGSLNAFFGGVGMANNVDLQPFRDGTSGIDTVLNFTAGDVINGSTGTLANPGGFGGSIDHVGSTFTAGDEGYIGFKLNGTNYGWMRVVFTNNTSGAVIKDWAYDNSGGAIAVGNITHSGSTLTADSSFGDFTVASVLADSGGTTNLLKTGAGAVTLTGSNTYTGATNVNAGTLLINNTTGSGTGSGTVNVGVNGTLGGSGIIAGATTIEGFLNPGNSPGVLRFSNSLTLGGGAVSTFEINGLVRGDDFDGVDVGTDMTLGGSLVLDIGTVFAPGTHAFELFDVTGNTTSQFSSVTLTGDMGSGSFTFDNSDVWTLTSGLNHWSFTQSTGTLQLTPIPEPSVALLGGLGLIVIMRRRRE